MATTMAARMSDRAGRVSSRGPGASRPRSMKRLSAVVVRLWFPTMLLGLWFVTSRSSESPYYPPMLDVLTELREQFLSGEVTQTLLPSLVRLSIGFAAALVIGLVLGWWLGTTRWTRRALMPVLDFFRSTPAIALMPIFIAVIGAGQTSEILLIAWASVWPVLLSTTDGVANVDAGYRASAAVMRMTAIQRMRWVDLPCAAPRIFAGVHTAVSIAITAMVAIEIYSAITGLGQYLSASQTQFNLTASWAGAVAAGIVGYVLSIAVLALERRWILRWYYAQRGAVHS